MVDRGGLTERRGQCVSGNDGGDHLNRIRVSGLVTLLLKPGLKSRSVEISVEKPILIAEFDTKGNVGVYSPDSKSRKQ